MHVAHDFFVDETSYIRAANGLYIRCIHLLNLISERKKTIYYKELNALSCLVRCVAYRCFKSFKKLNICADMFSLACAH